MALAWFFVSARFAVSVVIIMSLAVGLEARDEEQKPFLNRKLETINYEALNLFPDSFDWDAKHRRFLVGSMTHGKLVAVDEKGVVEEFVEDEAYAGKAALLGVTVDPTRNRVLAVVNGFIKNSSLAAIAAYDLKTKKRLLYVALNNDDPKIKSGINDVAVDNHGNAYVTDSFLNSVWKVTPSGEKILLNTSLPRRPVISKVQQGWDISVASLELINTTYANGIVYRDGYLIISQTSSGSLIRVSLADRNATVVTLNAGQVLPVADGLALRPDGSLVVISFHRAWLVSSKDSWSSATVLEELLLDQESFTTSVVAKGSHIFTLQSHMLEALNGKNRDSYNIQEIVFHPDSDNNPLWLLAIVGIFVLLVLVWNFQMKQFNTDYTKKRV